MTLYASDSETRPALHRRPGLPGCTHTTVGGYP
jgi:hypothetical protein